MKRTFTKIPSGKWNAATRADRKRPLLRFCTLHATLFIEAKHSSLSDWLPEQARWKSHGLCCARRHDAFWPTEEHAVYCRL